MSGSDLRTTVDGHSIPTFKRCYHVHKVVRQVLASNCTTGMYMAICTQRTYIYMYVHQLTEPRSAVFFADFPLVRKNFTRPVALPISNVTEDDGSNVPENLEKGKLAT